MKNSNLRVLKKNLYKALLLSIIVFTAEQSFGQHNTLWIPDTLSGTAFNLTVKDTFAQLRKGNQTITASVNKDCFWGPTLIFKKGDTVHLNVLNKLNDSTTIHWHGMHLPGIMDGGPHQIIPPGTLWQPYWKVTNDAATLWYHPHLMDMTLQQIIAGIGGFIIIRDSLEASMALPRTYGIDDIPLALTSRSYNTANQFLVTDMIQISQYGDYMLTNGTPNAQVSLPKQVIRFRILNAEVMRGYNLGFSDNRTFYIIGNDQGLLNAPAKVTRVYVMPGERIEVLADLSKNAVGDTLDMNAFNNGLPLGFPGGDTNKQGVNGSLLNDTVFTVLHINVTKATANAVTTIPAKLANNTYWTAKDAGITRTFYVSNGTAGLSQYFFDDTAYDFNRINVHVVQNTIEQWTIADNYFASHTFHMHGVEFKIIRRSPSLTGFADTVQNYESGWKDNVFVSRGDTVVVVAKFTDVADSLHPFMFHCHMLNHEQGGMMGQFTVSPSTVGINEIHNPGFNYTLYPNPVSERLFVHFTDPNSHAYYIKITDLLGRIKYMLPSPQLEKGINISNLSAGEYLLQLTDDKTKLTTTRKFIKE